MIETSIARRREPEQRFALRSAAVLAVMLALCAPPAGLSAAPLQAPLRAPVLQAPPAHTLRPVAELGGTVHAVVGEGDFAYVALHSRLLVYDGRRPEDGPVGRSEPLGPRIRGLAVRDGTVLAVGDELTVLDVRDPRAIAVRARLSLPRAAEGVAWVGDEAWLWRADDRVLRVDLAELARPRLLTAWPLEEWIGGEGARRVHAIAGLANGLGAITVTADQAPRRNLLIAAPRPGREPEVLALPFVPCCPALLAAHGDWLAAADPAGDLWVAHVDPDGALLQKTVYPRPFEWEMVHGLALGPRTLWVFSEQGQAATYDLEEQRVLDPPRRMLMGQMPLRGAAPAAGRLLAFSLTVGAWHARRGEGAQLPDFGAALIDAVEPAPGGAWALDLQGWLLRAWPTAPHQWRLGRAHYTRIGKLGPLAKLHLGAAGDRVHVAAEDTWLDLRATHGGAAAPQPHVPSVEATGRISFRGLWATSTEATVARLREFPASDGQLEELLYVRRFRDGQEHRPGLVRFNPQVILPQQVALDGDHMWTLLGIAGGTLVRAYDTSGESSTLRPLGAGLTLPVAPGSVLQAQGGVLVTGVGVDLHVIDGRHPASPRLAGTIDLPGTVTEAAIDGSRLWAGWSSGGEDGGLALLDLQQPDWPDELASAPLGAAPFDLALSDGRLWVAAGALQAYELPDAGPRETWRIALPILGKP